jgi:cytochrome bd-type quinol oxidase subunit 2
MVFDTFFTHSDVNVKWWGPAKITLIVATILLLVMTGMNMYDEQKTSNKITYELWIPSISVLIFIFYIATLTSSCLKASKCSILAFFHLLAPFGALIGLGIFMWARTKGFIKEIGPSRE